MKHHTNGDDRRALARISMRPEKPVHLEVSLDGEDVAMLVENMSTGGATVIYPEDSESLTPGTQLKDTSLDLPDIGRVPVTAVVRWRIWPKVGIQFYLTSDASDKITRFLAT
jgi:hypothetical protein